MLQRTPLASKNLSHNLPRTVVSIGGVTLAIVLMFMQLGFLGAVGDTATVVYQRMPMDLVVRSPDYLHLFEPAAVDDGLRRDLAGLAEVGQVLPLDTTLAAWYNPRGGETRSIAVLGVDPEHPAVRTGELAEKLERLTSDAFVLVDRESGPEFVPDAYRPPTVDAAQPPAGGVINAAAEKVFGPQHIGARAEVNGREVRIVETFELGTGLAAAGAMVTSRSGFRRLMRGQHDERTSLLLIRSTAGVPLERTRAAVRRRLDMLGHSALPVLTRREALRSETWRWYFETPIGLIFWMGVGLAVVVGSVICYMVLAAEVLANLAEYATLKAIGYSNRYMAGVLLRQSLLIAALAYLPAVVISLLLYAITGELADIPIRMTPGRLVLVAVLSMLMCTVAGSVALRKLAKAEPASLF
jgi:putative ABC transport system permease protein